MKIVVGIPCYRCERQVQRVIKRFYDHRPSYEAVDAIFVIDNRSTDATAEKAIETIREYGLKKISVIRNTDNYNLGGSHKILFLEALRRGADYAAIVHGDDQADVAELEQLIAMARQHPDSAAILGARFIKGSRLHGYSFARTWGNIGLNALYSLVAMRRSVDLGSGLNLFRMKDLADKRFLQFTETITFNIDILLDYFDKDADLTFAPITWREEDQISTVRAFDVGRTAVEKLLKWRFGKPVTVDRTEEALSYETLLPFDHA